MRLVYVTASFPFGPGEAFFEEETAELVRQGWDLLIVPRSPRGGLRDLGKLEGYSVNREPLVSIDILRDVFREFVHHPTHAAKCFRFILRDVPHLARNMAIVPKALWLARLAREWQADHIHAHWGSTTSTMAMIASELSGIPWSMTVHRWDILDANLLREKARRAVFVRAISQDGVDLLRQRLPMADTTRIELVHMGVSVPAGRRLIEAGSGEPTPFTLMCAGLLIERKGHKYLLEAIAGLKQKGAEGLSLLVAGDGPLRAALEAKTAELHLESEVTFLGGLTHARLLEHYASGDVDVAILPSLHEGIPVVLIEAMSYGLPVIATDVGGVSELCRPECGVLVPPSDRDALEGAIGWMMGHRAELPAMGEAGRRIIKDEFSIEVTVQRLSALVMGHR